MNPIEGIGQLVDKFALGSWERFIVRLLADHARGRKNAKPLEWLVSQAAPVFPGKVSRNKIQNTVVRASRMAGTPCFICSCHEGLYIALNREDVAPMRDFYTTRIAKESYNRSVMESWASEMV